MKLFDLSIPVYDKVPGFPQGPKCAIIRHATIDNMGRNVSQLIMSTHQGTHVDSPIHFIEGGKTIDQIPLESFLGEVLRIDLSKKGRNDRITVSDLESFENDIRKIRRVVIQTDWNDVFPDQTYYTDFPCLCSDAAQWLIDQKIEFLGLDLPAPHSEIGECTVVHKNLLASDVVIVEGLANLKQVPKEVFYLLVLPLYLKGVDGAPARAVGMVDFLN